LNIKGEVGGKEKIYFGFLKVKMGVYKNEKYEKLPHYERQKERFSHFRICFFNFCVESMKIVGKMEGKEKSFFFLKHKVHCVTRSRKIFAFFSSKKGK